MSITPSRRGAHGRSKKHLAGCSACTAEVKAMQATVNMLHAVPRHDTSDGFMAALHARLDTVSPSAESGYSLWRRLRDWFSVAGASLYGNRVSALSLGLAAAVIALAITLQRPVEPVVPAPAAFVATDSDHITIATSANSPFSDPAADNLSVRTGERAGVAATSF